MFEPSEYQKDQILLALDSDTLIAGDFSNLLQENMLQAKVPDGDLLTSQGETGYWEEMFEYFGLKRPNARYQTSLSKHQTHGYFNSGVVSVSTNFLPVLHKRWGFYVKGLIDNFDQMPRVKEFLAERVDTNSMPKEKKYLTFIDQYALSLAVEDAQIPYEIFPLSMNFTTIYNRKHQIEGEYIREFNHPHQVVPLIVHHHHRFSPIEASGYKMPDQTIAKLNKALQSYKQQDEAQAK